MAIHHTYTYVYIFAVNISLCFSFLAENTMITTSRSVKSQTALNVKMSIVEVSGVHRSLPNVKHVVQDTEGMDKMETLLTILEVGRWVGGGGYLHITLIFQMRFIHFYRFILCQRVVIRIWRRL